MKIHHTSKNIFFKGDTFNEQKNIWALASVFIAILSIWAVVSQAGIFHLRFSMSFIGNANKGWLFMSFCLYLDLYGLRVLLWYASQDTWIQTKQSDGAVYGFCHGWCKLRHGSHKVRSCDVCGNFMPLFKRGFNDQSIVIRLNGATSESTIDAISLYLP